MIGIVKDIEFFFENIFNTNGFLTRWDAGVWENLHAWTHITSDLVIGIAYLAIPVMLFTFALRKKDDLPFNYLFILFSLFIFLCGAVHFIEVSIFWQPWYRLLAIVKFFTAIVSVLAAYELFKILPEAFALRTDKELKEAIARKTQKLKKSGRALMRSNAELEEFAYVATHDIQEPIRMIKQNILRLENHLKDHLDARANKYLGFIKDGSDLVENLTKDLLEYSRLKSELIDFKAIDLNTVLDRSKEAMQLKIQERQVEIINDKLPCIEGVESLLIRLFSNLISNSIKYCDTGYPPVY